MIYSISAAAVNIALTILLVQRLGVTGAILGTVAAYLVCILVPQWIEVERALQDPSGDSTRNSNAKTLGPAEIRTIT
jgi:Na+-driven multidrug efflux pump